MEQALREAWKYQLLTYPNPAVGAVVVSKEGRILSVAAHREAGGPHAEVLAIKEAYWQMTGDEGIDELKESAQIHDYVTKRSKKLFDGCTLYVTLEPCNHYGKTPPCSMLIERLGFGRVVVGTNEPNPKAAGGIQKLKSAGLCVETGVLREEAEKLIEPFVLWQKERFVFFKLAQTLNGAIGPGTISSDASLDQVHRLRSKIDLLVIGGNTVRKDRPRLDSRRIGGRAFDVLIFSRQKTFDPTIALFGVEGRKVFIEDSLARIEAYNFVMIEGGEGMLEATALRTDWYLFFVAPRISLMCGYGGAKELEFLHTQPIGPDLVVWARKIRK